MKEGWVYKKLGEVCDFVGGSQPPKSEWINHPQEGFVRMLQIRDFTKSRKFEIEYVKNTKKLRLCNADDILIGRYGASVGKILTGLAGAYNVAIIKSIPDEKIVSKSYILRYFESYLFQSVLYKVCASRAAQAGFSKDDICDSLIPIPPLSEQQSIVEYIDSAFAKIDAMKANAEKALNEAKALFQASLKEMLEPKEGWEEKAIKDFATDLYRGSGVKREQVTKEGVSCVRYGEIYTKYNYHFSECYSHTLAKFVNSPKYFEHGDILFAITGESVEEIGKSIAYTGNEKCIAGGDIVVMKHNYEPRYISYALSTPSSVKQKGQGKTKLKVVHTNIPSLKEIIIPIAPINEQKKIADTLDTLKSKVDRLQANYDKISQECDALKQAILRQVFE